jgi:hypothetical protein
MALIFPNPSCSFDTAKDRVRFWGYDSVIEVVFFVEVGALEKLCPEMTNGEAGFLKSFDVARQRIHQVAAEVYEHGRKGASAYILAAKDF